MARTTRRRTKFRRQEVVRNINLGVSWYLMASYLYYQENVSLISDDDFDWLGRTLLKSYDTVVHRHWHLITRDELAAGTLLLPSDKYPEITKDTAIGLYNGRL